MIKTKMGNNYRTPESSYGGESPKRGMTASPEGEKQRFRRSSGIIHQKSCSEGHKKVSKVLGGEPPCPQNREWLQRPEENSNRKKGNSRRSQKKEKKKSGSRSRGEGMFAGGCRGRGRKNDGSWRGGKRFPSKGKEEGTCVGEKRGALGSERGRGMCQGL